MMSNYVKGQIKINKKVKKQNFRTQEKSVMAENKKKTDSEEKDDDSANMNFNFYGDDESD